MTRLLHADFFRMYTNKRFWLCAAAMLGSAVMFIVMQATAMDYTVPLSRVIFLPMTFYGVAVAALVSLFVGEDFSDGGIRNKLIAGRSRGSVFLSNLLVSWTACIAVYLITTVFTACVGSFYFEIDVSPAQFMEFLALGLLMCLAYGSIYCTVTMLCGSKATSVMLCMGLAFFLLYLSLQTHQVLAQQEYKDGVLNPHYVRGIKKAVYNVLHDLNPTGQAAQLSAMAYFNSLRWIVCDLIWMASAAFLGSALFRRKEIK